MEPKPNKNEALEALDFIINVLKEHEKDLDRLIGQLGIITESLGDTGEITEKIEKIEDRISNLQCEIGDMIKNVAAPQGNAPSVKAPKSPVSIKCRKWEDFKAIATGSEILSYLFKTSENTFQAEALKDGKVVTYLGEIPSNSTLLKLWISKELDIDKGMVFEGNLNIG
jgi:hypothetical protein